MRASRLALATLVMLCAAAAPGRAEVQVVFGTSWDGPSHTLQAIVDARYGPGQLSVAPDYIGAGPADLDPWFWVGDQFSALLVTEVAGNAGRNQLGWYEETFSAPVLLHDGIHDGLVFDGPEGAGTNHVIVFAHPMTKFGFYLDPNGPLGATNAPQPERFFSNRLYNDLGPAGAGALHSPWNGDVQALVFEVSAWTAPNTWLVCFEDLDSGAIPGAPGESQTDNDFNDLVFEVTALGATPARTVSLGELKSRYRR